MEENQVLYIEVPEALNKQIESLTSGANRRYSSKAEFVRAAIREKIQKENI